MSAARGITPVDYMVVGGYLTLIMIVAVAASVWKWMNKKLISMRTTARAAENDEQSDPSSPRAIVSTRLISKPAPPDSTNAPEDFFLADRAASWWVVAASFFASNIGTDAIVGLSSAGASVGIAAASFDLASSTAFIALAYLFLPVYRSSGVYTLPEWAEARFSRPVRLYLACMSLVLYALAKVSVALYCGSLVLAYVTGASPWAGVAALLVLTAAFSIAGGLRAVLAVEVWNTVLLLLGGAAASIVAVQAVGGLGPMLDAIKDGTSAAVREAGMTPSMAHLAQPLGAPYALPALIVGTPWLILWFHTADQEMVQRGLSGSTHAHAKLGSVLAGWLKLTVPWTWALPGLAARLLFPSELGCSPHVSVDSGSMGPTECTKPNLAYPVLITKLLPEGLSGAMLAACLAGVLSVLASTLNSASTLATMDLVRVAARTMRTPMDQRDKGIKARTRAMDAEEPMDDDDGEEEPEGSTACCPPRTVSTAFRRVRSAFAWMGRYACAGCTLPYRPRLGAALLKPNTLVWIGRFCIILLVCVSLLWLPVLPKLAPSLYTAMQSLNAYVAPPVAVVFTAGLLWPAATAEGAMAALVCGHSLGLFRLLVELTLGGGRSPGPTPMPPPPSRQLGARASAASLIYSIFAEPDFLYFAFASGVLSIVVLVAVSLRTPATRQVAKHRRQQSEHQRQLAAIAPLTAPVALRCGRRMLLLRARMLESMGYHADAEASRVRAQDYATVLAAVQARQGICQGCGHMLRVEKSAPLPCSALQGSSQAPPLCSPGFAPTAHPRYRLTEASPRLADVASEVLATAGTAVPASEIVVRSPCNTVVSVLQEGLEERETSGSLRAAERSFPTPHALAGAASSVAALVAIAPARGSEDRIEEFVPFNAVPAESMRQMQAVQEQEVAPFAEASGRSSVHDSPDYCSSSSHCHAHARKERTMNAVADVAAVGLALAVLAITIAIW